MKFIHHMKFVATATVLHPETGEELIVEGLSYTSEQLAQYCYEYGMDNIPCVAVPVFTLTVFKL